MTTAVGRAPLLIRCAALWGLSLCAAQSRSAGAAVDIARFTCDADDDDAWWIAITAQRKLIEWLADGGVDVTSAFTAPRSASRPALRIQGGVELADSIATLRVRLARDERPVAAASVTAPKGDFRRLRGVLGELLVYGLDVDRHNVSPKGTSKKPTRSNYAFGLYLLAKRELRAGRPQDAVGLLKEALERDSLFATACWTISEIERARNHPAESEAWESRAATIDADHPRWPYLDSAAGQQPVEGLLRASRATPPTRVAPGLTWKRLTVEQCALDAIVWDVDPDVCELDICMQNAPTGDRIEQFRQRCKADIALNGGFFEIDRDLHLRPSGLVVRERKVLAPVSPNGGSGVLYVRHGRPGITWSKDVTKPEAFDLALQCGPVIVEHGGVMGVYGNDYARVNRSAVGVGADGKRIVLVTVAGEGGRALSLYELARFLRAPRDDGGCGCDAALNLDGGSSSQMSAHVGNMRLHVPGLWTVNNALVLRRK